MMARSFRFILFVAVFVFERTQTSALFIGRDHVHESNKIQSLSDNMEVGDDVNNISSAYNSTLDNKYNQDGYTPTDVDGFPHSPQESDAVTANSHRLKLLNTGGDRRPAFTVNQEKCGQKEGLPIVVTKTNNGDRVLRFRQRKITDNEGTRQVGEFKKGPFTKVLFGSRSKNHHQCLIIKKIANCSDRGLTKVPQNLPVYINSLILSENRLTSDSLRGGPFKRYRELAILRLNTNKIPSLPDNAFEGIPKLIYLDLSNNSIKMDNALNQSKAFAPLRSSLRRLILNRNNMHINSDGLMYPDMALSYLTNLKSLDIDGLPGKTFGSNFLLLKKLESLQMSGYSSGYCNLSILSNNTFDNVPTIQLLNITDCKLMPPTMGTGALQPLKNLESLDVSYNFKLGLDGLGELMYGQRANLNLKHLRLDYIIERYTPCIIVYKETLKYFEKLNLETLQANHNNIEMIEFRAISNLPKTLKDISLTQNKIMLGKYWLDLKRMTNLKSLKLDGFDKAFKLPLSLPPASGCYPHHQRNAKNMDTSQPLQADMHLTLSLPPKLENVTMKNYYLSYKINVIEIDSVNILKNLDLHGNFFPVLTGPIYGLSSLQYLDMTSCFIKEISNGFFSNFKSLKTLYLYQNLLGEFMQGKLDSSMFASESLQELFIGMNNFHKLDTDIFKDTRNLKKLDLSVNALSFIEFSLEHTPDLIKLNLSNNVIGTLPRDVMAHFDKMISRKNDVSIDMSNNPIICDCDNIEFIKWITRTKIFGTKYRNYFCYYPHHQTKKLMTNGYDEELKILIHQCANNIQLFICVISATIIFFLILIGVVIYRFRWSMRYWYHVTKVMFTSKPHSSSIEYEYDVYVCYCHQDKNFIAEELGVKLGTEGGLKLLLHDKCLQAGQKMAHNILMAIQQSRKTLVVMSKAMMDSTWCNHEIEMARQEAISTGRDVLVILFLETIPRSAMNLSMAEYICSNVTVTYPSNPEEREEFWNKLVSDLNA